MRQRKRARNPHLPENCSFVAPCVHFIIILYKCHYTCDYNAMATKISRNSRNGKQANKQTTNHIGKWDFKVQFAVWLYNVEYGARDGAVPFMCTFTIETHTHMTKKNRRLHTFVFGAINNKHTRANIITCNAYTDTETAARERERERTKEREIYSHKFTMNYEILACALPPLHITYLWNKLNTHAHEQASARERSTDG